MVGYALKWFCYNPEMPLLLLLPAPLMAFGLGGLFTLMGSMIADVCDYDELNTNERREGMFGSIYWWVVKLGMALALAAGGFLLNATGFDVAFGKVIRPRSTIFMMRVSSMSRYPLSLRRWPSGRWRHLTSPSNARTKFVPNWSSAVARRNPEPA